MKKVSTKNVVFDEMKLPELFAQALSQKLDKPYEETLKYVSALFENKIEKVEKTIALISQQSNISIEDPKDFEEWIKDSPVIKG